MDKVPNARIKQLCGVMKSVGEKIYESVLRLFEHVERMENDRIAKRVYVEECVLVVAQWVGRGKGGSTP